MMNLLPQRSLTYLDPLTLKENLTMKREKHCLRPLHHSPSTCNATSTATTHGLSDVTANVHDLPPGASQSDSSSSDKGVHMFTDTQSQGSQNSFVLPADVSPPPKAPVNDQPRTSKKKGTAEVLTVLTKRCWRCQRKKRQLKNP